MARRPATTTALDIGSLIMSKSDMEVLLAKLLYKPTEHLRIKLPGDYSELQ